MLVHDADVAGSPIPARMLATPARTQEDDALRTRRDQMSNGGCGAGMVVASDRRKGVVRATPADDVLALGPCPREIPPAGRVPRRSDDDDPVRDAIPAVAGVEIAGIVLEGYQHDPIAIGRSRHDLRSRSMQSEFTEAPRASGSHRMTTAMRPVEPLRRLTACWSGR